MNIKKTFIIFFIVLFSSNVFSQDENKTGTLKDTTYSSIATTQILNMLKKGKAPRVTLQVSFNFNIGHLDLAASENTSFSKDDFIGGANFGTRYGFGTTLTGKIALHKDGNVRLNITAAYNRFASNFVISESSDGKVAYNVFSWGLGIENNFSPVKKLKPFLGLDLIASLISGNALLTTDTADFDLKIKNSMRYGVSVNLGFEYAFNNNVGFNLGYKLTYANLIGRESKVSASLNETFLNDDKVTGEEVIPYAGWRQFVYSSFYTGINIYFGMKNKR